VDLLHLYTQLVTTSNYNTIADFHFTDHLDTLKLLSLHWSFLGKGFITVSL
jgi:hypothetical protein